MVPPTSRAIPRSLELTANYTVPPKQLKGDETNPFCGQCWKAFAPTIYAFLASEAFLEGR